jgi:hypothetical protein
VSGTPAGFTPTGTVTYQFFTTSDGTGAHTDEVVPLNAAAPFRTQRCTGRSQPALTVSSRSTAATATTWDPRALSSR